MNLFRRIKNLWALSAYSIENMNPRTKKILSQVSSGDKFITLKKDFPTIEHKPATIILDKPDYFKEENGDTT